MHVKKINIPKFKEHFDYYPKTGLILRKKGSSHYSGLKCAGSFCNGYHILSFKQEMYLAHRVAWSLFYEKEPIGFIDHINGDGYDNRIVNLRDVTQSKNSRNTKMSIANKSGHKGVIWHKTSKKWCAFIRNNNKHEYLGVFTSKYDAIKIRKEKEKEYGYTSRR